MKKRIRIQTGFLSKISYLFGAALIIASLLINLTPPSVVSAHSNNVSGSSVCLFNGFREVTWTIKNDFNSPVTIQSINRTVSGIPVNTVIGNFGSVSGTELVDGSVTGSITLTIYSRWTSDGYERWNSGSVNLGLSAQPPPRPRPPRSQPRPPAPLPRPHPYTNPDFYSHQHPHKYRDLHPNGHFDPFTDRYLHRDLYSHHHEHPHLYRHPHLH